VKSIKGRKDITEERLDNRKWIYPVKYCTAAPFGNLTGQAWIF